MRSSNENLRNVEQEETVLYRRKQSSDLYTLQDCKPSDINSGKVEKLLRLENWLSHSVTSQVSHQCVSLVGMIYPSAW